MAPQDMPSPDEVAPDARALIRGASKVALATIERGAGGPFLSMTGVGAAMDGSPILLLSTLARHTKNLNDDARASLLFEAPTRHANPLTQARVSLIGKILPSSDEHDARRFMARQPKAFYSQFGDFAFYRMEVEFAHFIGGFGVALTIEPQDLLLAPQQWSELVKHENDILTHMNEDHAPLVSQFASRLFNENDGDWRLTGLDPEGCDLRSYGQGCR